METSLTIRTIRYLGTTRHDLDLSSDSSIEDEDDDVESDNTCPSFPLLINPTSPHDFIQRHVLGPRISLRYTPIENEHVPFRVDLSWKAGLRCIENGEVWSDSLEQLIEHDSKQHPEERCFVPPDVVCPTVWPINARNVPLWRRVSCFTWQQDFI